MTKPKGTLIALGGGDDDGLLQLIRADYCQANSVVEVITTAAPSPQESGDAYQEAFVELGLKNAHVMHIDEQNEADKPEYLERINQADVFFFTGGDQRRINQFLLDTQVQRLMQQRYQEEEIVIAGTSAGASAISNRMIYEGYGSNSLVKGETKTCSGLSFVQKLYIDSHFTERGRFGRLAVAIAKWPDYLGIGLGEETGVIIKEGSLVEVFGPGVVTIIDGSQIQYCNIDEVAYGSPIAVENLVMHLLVEGHRYCITDKRLQPILKQVSDSKN
jgi:cyanophycinase